MKPNVLILLLVVLVVAGFAFMLGPRPEAERSPRPVATAHNPSEVPQAETRWVLRQGDRVVAEHLPEPQGDRTTVDVKGVGAVRLERVGPSEFAGQGYTLKRE